MNLKKITLLGFKSFAEKSEMVLTKGITTLVGPNGCGKSNLVDAVRWVLGEQSIKMLRGGKTEDVIFNGCDTRKALGMAEVTLTFDNTSGRLPIDYNEVSITRRLFRSGESMYLINKTQCRLKDIHQLLLDTGVGTSSYSIIEQGKMDWIINAKPNERREIFEEAAGIIKYKNKRKEAQRRLKNASDNLTRLKDIISELETQKNSVSRQASKAKRFKKLSQELKLLDSQNTLHKFENFSQQIDKDSVSLKENESFLEIAKKEISELEHIHHNEIEQISELDQELKRITEKKFEQENQISQIQVANEHKHTRIKDIQDRLDNSSSDVEIYQQKSIELKNLLEQTVTSKDELQKEIIDKKEDVSLQEEKTRIAANKIEEKKNFIFEYKEKLEELTTSNNSNQQKQIEYNLVEKNLEQQINKQSDEISEIQLTLNFEEDQYQIVKDKSNTLKAKSDEISNSLKEKEETVKESTETLKKLETSMMTVSTELSEKNSRKETLEDLKNSYEGFYVGVKAIMLKKQEDPDTFRGIIGVVPDVIKVNSGYETAVEASLGARIQNIIVETGENAKYAIDFLKRHKLGRVTFLPIDMVKGRKNQPPVPSDSRILGKLTDFIDYEEKYTCILDSLLGNFLVVKHIDSAISIMKEGLKGYNIITLEGELISGTGAITGGEIKSSSKGIFSRENEIDELDKRSTELRELIISKNEKRNEIKNKVDRITSEIDNLKIHRSTSESDYQHALRDLQKAEFQRESMQKRINMLYGELEKAQEKLIECTEKKEALNKNIENSTEQNANIKTSITSYEQDLENAYNNLSQEKENHSKIKTELTSLEDKLLNLNERINEIRLEKNERESWLKNLNQNNTEQTSLIDTLLNEINEGKETLQSLQNEDTILIERIENLTQKLNILKSKTEDFEEKRKNTSKEIEEIQEKNTTLKIRMTEYEGKINNLREHVYSKYQLRLENIEKTEIEIPWEEIPEKVDNLENKIQNLGNVNMEAIEELEKLEKRFIFLTEQEKDLSNAAVKLNDVISKTNKRATEMFNETFDQVKVYFSDIYSELFGGGKAELKLNSHEDFLEAGIDIIARPPGKNPQTISLLSGGEKALTATALLFALFKIKPSPFCIIDELDAPLDDTNISRFTKMLSKFSSETQFIVITHNKNTLKIADLLYGVTQPVKGISTFISIKFIDEDLDHLLEEPKAIKSLKKQSKSTPIIIKEDEELASLELPKVNKIRLKSPEEELAEAQALQEQNERMRLMTENNETNNAETLPATRELTKDEIKNTDKEINIKTLVPENN